MERDVMYYFDKKSPYKRHELGEVQTNFGFGLTIDGAKDSAQIQVFNFNETRITPNTILYHKATNTWWVVSRDIVKRNASEKNYYYTHNLTLNGAGDLLNARDYTDSGYNDNTYTIDTFIKRLFKLSTFEFPITINYGNNVDENKVVDYIKSFENYTLQSALREFLNGYNCDYKLVFNTTTSGNDTFISSATLIIIPRTGNVDLEMVDIDDFDDIRETRTANKESYATTVVSNAQNVTSTLAKTYPQIGGTSLTGDSYNTSSPNLFFRTPTPIYDIVWLRAMSKIRFMYGGYAGPFFYPQSYRTFEKYFDQFYDYLTQDSGGVHFDDVPPYPSEETKEKLWRRCIGTSQVTFYCNGFNYNPHGENSGTSIIKKEETPYLAYMMYDVYTSSFRNMLLTDKQTYNGIKNPSERALYFERGDDKIRGFGIFFNTGSLDHATDTYYPSRCDLKLFGFNSRNLIEFGKVDGAYCYVGFDARGDILNRITRDDTMWQINYIPMSDIKIKYDNARNDRDIKIYNQNGKLNDSVALSKMVDSYSKEVQSDNITRYMHYTDFSEIPQVGTLVNAHNGEIYVINNVSYDFFVNEECEENELSYYIECEFTLSKYISVKSLMVNPNSNIRDYGIPQKYNVKRRQTYRDYFEFSLTADSDANVDTPYVALDNYITIGESTEQHHYDHTAIIKVDFEEPVDNHLSWYYQLNSTAYVMNKSIYELVDFNDNNIIGYDMQTRYSGFNMSDIFNVDYKNIITPVSYVDDSGRVKGITMQMVNNENLQKLYDDILANYGRYDTQTLSSHCFVGENFYYGKFGNHSQTVSFSTPIITEIDYGGVITIDLTENGIIDSSVEIDTSTLSIGTSLIRVLNEQGTPIGVDYTQSNITNSSLVKDSDNHWVLSITLDSTTYVYYEIGVSMTFTYTQTNYQIYQGAIDLKDYEIKELDYDKDAIEVPVFEYILQLGDTEEVEVGERILDTGSGLLQMYTCDVRNPNTTTQLNASKVFSGLEIDGDTLSDNADYNRQVEIADTSAVDISFEENNTKMRIKVYQSQTALFYGNSDQEFAYQSTQVSQTQYTKSQLIGKDIVIYKNVIKSMTYDIDEGVATCDYSNELMFIIHNPQEENFDGDALIVNVNYYKLN